MPRQNRVLPTGEIVAHSARGLFMGNRGILHDGNAELGRARWRIRGWVTCLLSFKGRKQQVMAPGRYTQLFFHDEAVAMAAGHRPCAECRRADYRRFRDAAGITGPIGDFDKHLHAARAIPRKFQQRRHVAEISSLPDGAFILGEDGAARLIRGDALLPFRPGGYLAPEIRPSGGVVTVLTPKPFIRALSEGYAPILML